MTKHLPAAVLTLYLAITHHFPMCSSAELRAQPSPYHISESLEESLVVLDVLRFILRASSRVDHAARLANYGTKMLLTSILVRNRAS